MAKMMNQLDLLSKHVMGGGLKSVNAVGTNIGQAQMMSCLRHYTMEKFNSCPRSPLISIKGKR
ncbi:hypothetical protein MTR67_023200 [Solanum verrucosum]|uniref:Uncharacterized protein n=1 Tax=Solanum verrucosum TaxID=315347 RepID=A0AAF0TXF5_SOLVR|nr:hypothetical protein MTR67_023200 [Solanum verrucosum]